VRPVNRPNLVSALRDAGLSPYQAEAYVTILDLGAAPVTDIADESGVPDPRIYDVLRDLEGEGYVELYEQESLQARAYSLEEVTEDLRTRASRFSEAAEEIQRRWERPSMAETSVSIVKQFDTAVRRAEEWIRAADGHVEVSLSPDHFERLRPALRAATAAGVEVYLSVYADGESFVESDTVEGLCTEARRRRIPSPFVAVVDRAKSCFAPHRGSANEYGVLVDDRTHTYVFHWFFLTTQWDVWAPFYEADDEALPTEYVDIRYCIRDVAPLLAEGETVRVRVTGTDLETGTERTVEGTVSDLLVTDGPRPNDGRSAMAYGGQAGMVVETDEETLTVGGWGAMVEELEAHVVTLLSVT